MSSSDKSDYKQVNNAMGTLGFKHNETQTIWNIVAGVLHLVNIVLLFTLFFTAF